jgi:hypothetical protein
MSSMQQDVASQLSSLHLSRRPTLLTDIPDGPLEIICTLLGNVQDRARYVMVRPPASSSINKATSDTGIILGCSCTVSRR